MVADPVPLQLAAELFPNGISRYAVGGLLVGLGAVVIYIGTGIPAGASTFLESTLSYVSGQSRFQQYVSSRDWRIVFTLGIILGGLAFAATVQSGVITTSLYQPGTTGELYEVGGVTLWSTDVQAWRLLWSAACSSGSAPELAKGVRPATESAASVRRRRLHSSAWRRS